MDFRRTLLLGDLGNRFITLPLASEFLAHRLALPGSGHKCETIALVHVVGIDSGRLIAMWIVPQVLSSVQLFYFGTYLPHRPTSPYQGEGLHKARSNSYPTWLSLITCYHFGYHFEHHYAPFVPWWSLPRFRCHLKEVLAEPVQR